MLSSLPPSTWMMLSRFDRVAQGLPELQLRQRLVVVRRRVVVDDVRVRRRGLRDRQVRVLLRLQAGDLLRGREGVPGHVGATWCSSPAAAGWPTGHRSRRSRSCRRRPCGPGRSKRPSRGCGSARWPWSGRTCRSCTDRWRPGSSRARALPGMYFITSTGARRERSQGQHVGEVRRRPHQLDHDGAVVLGDHARTARCCR